MMGFVQPLALAQLCDLGRILPAACSGSTSFHLQMDLSKGRDGCTLEDWAGFEDRRFPSDPTLLQLMPAEVQMLSDSHSP